MMTLRPVSRDLYMDTSIPSKDVGVVMIRSKFVFETSKFGMCRDPGFPTATVLLGSVKDLTVSEELETSAGKSFLCIPNTRCISRTSMIGYYSLTCCICSPLVEAYAAKQRTRSLGPIAIPPDATM